MKECCFTGHRNQKLPWGFNENNERYFTAKQNTKEEIVKAIQNGYNYFHCGMALGFDVMVAEIILELKKEYPNIVLECDIPCKDQEKKWIKSQQERYNNILKLADKVVFFHEFYVDGCMQERNRYMVDNSTMLIALYNGRHGGTKQTIDYAKEKGLQIIIIKP